MKVLGVRIGGQALYQYLALERKLCIQRGKVGGIIKEKCQIKVANQ